MKKLHDTKNFSFASDNYSGVHSKILEALAIANQGHQPAYGNDVYTNRLNQLIKQHFGEQAECFPVFNGTGANVLALQALLPRYGGVICAETAHINNDESTAPEAIGGFKIFPVTTQDGKLTPELIATQVYGIGFEHRAQPKVVYISQVTELGTCYTVQEIKNIADYCHGHDLKLYIDGARLANAAAYLDLNLREFTTDVGVDILSLGGTKNGLLLGECLVVLNTEIAKEMKYLRKMNMQLGSKMRFISAQFVEWLESGLWLELAKHSNAMAKHLEQEMKKIAGINITQPCQSNAVFAILDSEVVKKLHQEFHFYDWNEATGEIRLMTSFDTTLEQVECLVQVIKDFCTRGK